MTEREFGLAAIDTIIQDSVTGREQQSVRWESFTEEFIESIKTAKVFADCGAEYGFYIRLALKYGPPNIQIYAFEPEHTRFELLISMFENYTNVIIYPYALSNCEHVAVGCKPNAGVSLSFSGLMHSHGDIELLYAVSMDNVIPEKAIVDVIKMDIEGAEDQALAGMYNILKSKPKLFIEWHPVDLDTRRHTVSLLKAAGYNTDFMMDCGREVLCAA